MTEKPAPGIINRRLREAVLACGMTYGELSELSGVAVTTIAKYIGKHPVMPSAEKLAALCGAIGVSADWVMGLVDG